MKRIVVKLGTSVLTNGTAYLNRQRILEIVQQVAGLAQKGHEMIVVSSGAITAGRERLNYPSLGRSVPARQMLSAIGQSRLMGVYADMFDIFGITVGQVLLTREDLGHRKRYLNARDTLLTLIERGVVPVINENDTIATDEIKVGDNDNLSALVANLIDADLLVLLTDQPGLFTSDPRHDDNAQLIKVVNRIDERTRAIAGGAGSSMGTGGMATKIEAAQLASRSGVTTVVAAGKEPNVLTRIVGGEELGTRFDATAAQLESRKRWLIAEKPQGCLHVDSGAVRAMQQGGVSLLPVGVRRVEGTFERGDLLGVVTPEGDEFARGLANYSSEHMQTLCGVKSVRIEELLGYSYGDAAIHRNNMVLLS